MGKKTGVVSTSIQFEYTYSSERIEEILRLDWKTSMSLREVFPGMDATINYYDPNHPNSCLGVYHGLE